jgi:NADH:ubiquinone oxidoreductase subunit
MNFLLRLLTWWHGSTLGTQLHTWRRGVAVGEDVLGNTYYQSRDGKRRWVIFNGPPEASRVPPEWHGWLHHTFAETPLVSPLPRQPWELPPQENLTGTPLAYAPTGSLRSLDPARRRDYEAWRP